MSELKEQIVRCAKCRTNNRVMASSLKTPVCGKCRSPLTPSRGEPVTITDANFGSMVEASSVPVLLDMWAAWCGPCRMIAPTINDLAAELAGRILVGKMDVDANPNTSQRFRVQSIPTLLVFKEGREVDRIVGLQSKEAIIRRLQPFLK